MNSTKIEVVKTSTVENKNEVTTRFISGDISTHKYEVEFYKQDAVVKRPRRSPPPKGGKKKAVTRLTKKALSNMVFQIANADVNWLSMLTLTIHSDVVIHDGKILKSALNRFIDHYMKRKYGPLYYAWWMEFQDNGQPHFHIIFDILPPGPYTRRKSNNAKHNYGIDKELGTQWVKCLQNKGYDIDDSIGQKMCNSSAGWEIIKSADGAARYCAKECSKRAQKDVPDWFLTCGRFWGMSRGIKPKILYKTQVPRDELKGVLIDVPHGQLWIPYKVQHGFGTQTDSDDDQQKQTANRNHSK